MWGIKINAKIVTFQQQFYITLLMEKHMYIIEETEIETEIESEKVLYFLYIFLLLLYFLYFCWENK